MSHSSSAPEAALVDSLLALFAQGRLNEAGVLARQLTAACPDWGFGFKALAITLQVQGDVNAALAATLEAARLLPDDAEVHNNLGLVLSSLNRSVEAEAALRRALALSSDYAEAHNNLAIALLEQDRPAAASASLRRALELKPDYVKARNKLGLALQAQGRMGEAVLAYRASLALHPLYADAHSNLLLCLSQLENVDAAALTAEQQRYADCFEAPLRPHWPAHPNGRDPERVLRIGVVSGDLREHPVAALVEPVLAALANSARLTLHAYSNHAVHDHVSARLRQHFAGWTPIVGWDDAAVAARIAADAIDVLIDLSGHTAHNRLPVFARKPAPVQASAIGYPGSTGLAAIDYYLTDPLMLPPGQFDQQFSEALVHLPLARPRAPAALAPPVNRLPAIDNGYLTFGSFNRPGKLSRTVVALWSQLLRALPTARMLIGAMPADLSHDELASLFALNGVARQRLDFFPRTDMAAYLALHQRVDVCLDSFPCTGGATTLHALYMGVPTLTLAGASAAGHQGSGILRHLGLPGFIAADGGEFVALGAALAHDLDALAAIRASLRGRFAAGDAVDGGPHGVELALRAMWRRWCAGLAPAPLRIDPAT
jgi:protein O-GlcNAc transferase